MKLECLYCDGPLESVPTKCQKCGASVTGPIKDMTLAQIEAAVKANGYKLKVTLEPDNDKGPIFSLAS